MKLIKLDAIDSTNDFLKGLSKIQQLENFTVVTGEHQSKGRGQMGSSWSSEAGKNVIMSVLVDDFLTKTEDLFDLNIVVSVAITEALKKYNVPDLSIKWPNDIMSGNMKVGGILIENIIKSDRIYSIVGLGLNVNQINFAYLDRATSLTVVCKSLFDRDELLVSIIENIKEGVHSSKNGLRMLSAKYLNKLFKKGETMPFISGKAGAFNGIITGVSKSGKLQILLEDNSTSEYGIKEIQLLY